MFFSSPAWDEPVYWALDLETGGLDARTDPIIAVGMVPVRGGVVRLGESFSTLVHPEPGRPVRPESIRAHQLIAADLERAPSLEAVLREVDRRLGDGLLLVHNRAIDVAFLKDGHERARLPWRKPRVVDTVDLLARAAQRRQMIHGEAGGQPTFNLAEARREHGLPDYQAHDALTDAIATAELFLVLRKVIGAKKLRDLR